LGGVGGAKESIKAFCIKKMNPADRNLRKIESSADINVCFRSFVLHKKI